MNKHEIARLNKLTKEQLQTKWDKMGASLDLYDTFTGRQGEQLRKSILIQRSELNKFYVEKFNDENGLQNNIQNRKM